MGSWAYDAPVPHLGTLSNSEASDQIRIQISVSSWPGKHSMTLDAGVLVPVLENTAYTWCELDPYFPSLYISWSLHTWMCHEVLQSRPRGPAPTWTKSLRVWLSLIKEELYTMTCPRENMAPKIHWTLTKQSSLSQEEEEVRRLREKEAVVLVEMSPLCEQVTEWKTWTSFPKPQDSCLSSLDHLQDERCAVHQETPHCWQVLRTFWAENLCHLSPTHWFEPRLLGHQEYLCSSTT